MKKLFIIEIILFIAGALIATHLVVNHYSIINGEAFDSFCKIGKFFDCNLVNGSRFSEIVGIPIATFGLTYYIFAIVLVYFAASSVHTRRDAMLLLVAGATASVAMSIVMAAITIFKLRTACLMCMGLYAVNLTTFAFAAWLWKAAEFHLGYLGEWKNINRNRVLSYLITGVVLFVATQTLTMQLRKPIPFDTDAFLSEFRSAPVLNVEPGSAPHLEKIAPSPDRVPLQIVEFADYQCPACGVAAKLMHRLLQIYGDKIDVVFKNYPLDQSCNKNIPFPMHQYACFATKAAICAGKQGKFNSFHETLFSHQQELNPDNIITWAEQLGLERVAFNACLISEDTAAYLQKDIEAAQALGLNSTPTFYVSGKKIEGAIAEPKLRAILKELGKL
jgi:protein-disulfide isomerase/uncharacterized membrane protein